MKRTVLVNGREVEVDTAAHEGASVLEVEPGVYSVLWKGRSFEARVAPGLVEVDGEPHTTEVIDPRAGPLRRESAAAQGSQTLTAPMPGKIVRLLVAKGESVQPGQGILVIEAMKMQNEMKAVRGGVVTSLMVLENSAVAAGDVLAVIEAVIE